MKLSGRFTAGLATAIFIAPTFAQSTTRYCDALTSICYSEMIAGTPSIRFRVAIPQVTVAPFDLIIQVVAPVGTGWSGIAWGGQMTYNPLTVGWPNGNSVVYSSRQALGHNVPQAFPDAEYTPLRGTGVNSTHWTMTLRCRGCSQWTDGSGALKSLNPTGTSQLAFGSAQGADAVLNPGSNTTVFNAHNDFGSWQHDLANARSSNFDTWVANNLINGPTSTTTTGPTSTSTTTTTTTTSSTATTSSTTTSATTPGAPVPTSCSGVPANQFPVSVASGWRATKIAGGLRTPRGIVVDTAGNILIVQNGLGISVHTVGVDGCITSSKTLISQTNLNHGIYLSPTGTTLYASSLATVWSWAYNPTTQTISGQKTLVTGMSTAGHITRTLIVPKSKPNLLVVSVGSGENLDMPSLSPGVGRAIVKVFDMNSVPSAGYNYASGGWNAGYGLRNEVGLEFDGNDMLWGVENSADDIKRIANGQTMDIHNDNPSEELNYLGDVSTPNNNWYGYPTCFTVWQPSQFPSGTNLAIGDQFIQQPNSSYTDATCKQNSVAPRLNMQAHSAPLDCKFDAAYSRMFISFHGSWNRPSPTGFKVVVVPFSRAAGGGAYNPISAANSGTGYTDIMWNTDTTRCSATFCVRPVGLAFSPAGNLYVTSDSGTGGELFVLGSSSGGGPITSTSTSTTTTSSSTTTKPTTTTPTTTTTTTTTTTSSTTSTAGPTGCTVPKWGQCGGKEWMGCKVCAAGSTCQYSNDWYSQCL